MSLNELHVLRCIDVSQYFVAKWDDWIPRPSSSAPQEGTAMAKRKKRVTARKATTKRGKTPRKRVARLAAPKKAKRSVKKRSKKLTTKARRGRVNAKMASRKRKRRPAPAMPVEAAIVDVVEEPVPGVVVVSEFEAVRVAVPDSDEEDKD